ncbi:Flavin-containing monooxygenase FMO GS-OX-like 9 [Triticum urartu]|uniref:Flavin-containing monooxygenase n=1 Tax=Triticum urartu TaxID=4572 RepID=M8ADS5_TRIUA|nr:Flavin-containing monooxygenase FMO GS-OX-like 9 [Triticum urartu]
MEVRGVAKEVHLVAKSMEEVTPGLAKVLAKHSANLHLQLHVERLCEDGLVVFGGGGSGVLADTIIYCTTRAGPLFEHVFPPSLAPSLSFVGIPIKVFAPRFFEAQAKWGAQVLSGRRTLPPEQEMMRSVEEYYRAREIAGVPKKYTHDVCLSETMPTYMDDFGSKYCDFPRVERWHHELVVSLFANMNNNLETFREDYQDTDSICKGVEEWHLSAQQPQAAPAAKKMSLGLS